MEITRNATNQLHIELKLKWVSRKNELDADPKSFQQAKFTGQLKYPDSEIVAKESMFVLTILEKFKETRLKFSQGSVTVL